MTLFNQTPEQAAKYRKDRERAQASLRTAASVYPQQRIAQVIANALHGTVWEHDSFSLPDADLAAHLDKYAAGLKTPRSEEPGEIERLRRVLKDIDTFVGDSMNPVKTPVASNPFAALQWVRRMTKTALGQS